MSRDHSNLFNEIIPHRSAVHAGDTLRRPCTDGRGKRNEIPCNAACLLCMQALDRKLPPEFVVDASIMPAVRSRMKLAVRLDNAMRAGSKRRAEASWKAKAAKELDIDLDDDDEQAAPGRQEQESPQLAALQQVSSGLAGPCRQAE